MALSEGFQRYLGALGGGGPVAPLAQGLVTGLGSYAEQQKKKREEEKAREREGLTFALNQAIEAGDEEGIKRLGPQVYGGVDFGAVASAAKRKKEEADRAAARTRASELRDLLLYADPATTKELSNEIGRLTAQGLGLSPTIQAPTGKMIPSPADTETYTEQVPVPGTEFKAGAVLPVEQAQKIATERGLGAFFGTVPDQQQQRRVLKDIPALTKPETRTRPKMIQEMEERPRFSGFGSKKTVLTNADKRDLVNDMKKTARDEWRDLSEAGKKAFKAQYAEYTTKLTAALAALARGEDVELPEAKSFVGETRTDVKDRLSRESLTARIEQGRLRIEQGRDRVEIARQNSLSQRISANASATRGAAAMLVAQTGLKKFTSDKARKDFLARRDVKNALTKIEQEAVKTANREADSLYPENREKYASDEDFAAYQKERTNYVQRRAAAITEDSTKKWAAEQEPPAALKVEVRDPRTGQKVTVERDSGPAANKAKAKAGLADRPGARSE